MSYETILVETDAVGVTTVTFNRPEVRNALNQHMVDEVRRALTELAQSARVVIFTGAGGKAFLGGADIGELRARGRLDALRRINSSLFGEIERFPAPTIAAVRGYALGGGCELAMACDLRVAGAGAKLGQPEVALGILPGAGATYRMPRLVGLGRARELIYTGRIIDAQEALSIGLVNRVVPDDQVLASARELAAEIGKNSALAVRLAKQALNFSGEFSLSAGQAFESAAQAVLFEDEEKLLRMQAFLERKKAKKAEPDRVQLGGLFDAPQGFGFAELSAFPMAQQVPDVSERVPGREGRAVRLDALIQRCQPQGGATHVQVGSGDGDFTSSVTLEEARQGLLLYALDGAPLPADKGGPFRLLIPGGSDKCANVKHVARIELTAESGDKTASGC